MKHSVLFVDDEVQITKALTRALRKEPYRIFTASSADEAMALLARERVDVVVSDERMPGMSGTEFIALVRQVYPETIRIILTGHASLEMAIKAINEGEIYRFLTKPFNDVDLIVTIRQALQQKELMAESRRLLNTVRRQSDLLEELDRRHPGITAVKKDMEGTIIVEDSEGDLDKLIEQISAEINRSKAFLQDSSVW